MPAELRVMRVMRGMFVLGRPYLSKEKEMTIMGIRAETLPASPASPARSWA